MIKFVSTFLFIIAVLTSIGGAYATWKYANHGPDPGKADLSIGIADFDYAPPMPEVEVTVLNRLEAILNRQFTTDIVTDSRDYLLNETIQVAWDPGAPPYVGSMDTDYAFQIHELFGDVVDLNEVAFILKNEDLNDDGYNEIAMYSTSDPLDWYEGHMGLVGVYLTVFTPIVNEAGEVEKYVLLCDSIHGYCMEVNYHSSDSVTASFSTDHWVDELWYWHHEEPWFRPIPEEDRYDRENYHTYHYAYENCPWPGWIETYNGKTAEQRLAELTWPSW